MDMETVRLSNVSWLSISDRQIVALRAAVSRQDRPPAHLRVVTNHRPEPVPMLDWPSSLFADEITCH